MLDLVMSAANPRLAFGSSAGSGQFFESVIIQRLASSSVAKLLRHGLGAAREGRGALSFPIEALTDRRDISELGSQGNDPTTLAKPFSHPAQNS
jgi:hypothetical protein